MKIFGLLAGGLLLFCCYPERVAAQYYNAEKGTVLEYAEFDADGNITGYIEYLNKEVHGEGIDLTIKQEMTGSEVKEGGKVKRGRPSESMLEVVNGTATQSVDMQAKHGKLKIKMNVPYCVLPYTLSVGDVLEPFALKAKATILIISEEGAMEFRKRMVTGRETVETPAGSFDCFRIEEEATLVLGPINISVLGHSASEEVKNDATTTLKRILWVAQNIGIVKMQEFDEEGKQESDVLLNNIRTI